MSTNYIIIIINVTLQTGFLASTTKARNVRNAVVVKVTKASALDAHIAGVTHDKHEPHMLTRRAVQITQTLKTKIS